MKRAQSLPGAFRHLPDRVRGGVLSRAPAVRPPALRPLFTGRALRSYRDLDQAAEARMEAIFYPLLDAGVLLHTSGLGCLSTPMTDREVEELASAIERALAGS